MLNRLLIAGLIILIVQTTSGLSTDKIKSDKRDLHTNLLLMVGKPFNFSYNSFDEDYKTFLKGNPGEFKTSPIASLSIKFDAIQDFRYCITVDYSQSNYVDQFTEYFKFGNMNLNRSLNEKFDISDFPVLIGLDYVPSSNPYKSYLSFTTGVNFSKVIWYEAVSSQLEFEKRITGEKFNKFIASPVLRITSGIELNFDKKSENDFLKSLVAEARFSYYFRYVSIFKKLEEEDPKFVEIANKSYALMTFNLGLYLGLSFNISYL